jgi:hypothetical protein
MCDKPSEHRLAIDANTPNRDGCCRCDAVFLAFSDHWLFKVINYRTPRIGISFISKPHLSLIPGDEPHLLLLYGLGGRFGDMHPVCWPVASSHQVHRPLIAEEW